MGIVLRCRFCGEEQEYPNGGDRDEEPRMLEFARKHRKSCPANPAEEITK